MQGNVCVGVKGRFLYNRESVSYNIDGFFNKLIIFNALQFILQVVPKKGSISDQY